ncbi:SRR1-like protein [Armadillidium vulgare]|nr:SRR1-like protein [Armadillidium vulgare]
MEDDGFTLVSKRKTARKRKRIIPQNIEVEEDFDSSLRKIQAGKQKLIENIVIHTFLHRVRKSDAKSEENNEENYSSIICYGLGKISSCYNAQVQLAFLLILKEYLNIDNVLAYDPVFSPSDKKLLNYFHIDVINQNESAKRIVEEKTLFYMPHCPFSLYNNLIWANLTGNNLKNVFIIGNSFVNMVSDHISSKFNQKYKYISMVEPFVVECEFPKLKCDAFNDTKFVSFSVPLVMNTDSHYTFDEPIYSD